VRFVKIEQCGIVETFVPDPLPSRLTAQQLAMVTEPLRAAEAALARLDLAGEMSFHV
jgi:hypothetical protein